MAAPGEDFLYEKHVKFFKRTLAVLPASLSTFDPMRMTILYFGLSGLDVLNALKEIKDQRNDIIKWIYLLLIKPSDDEESLSRCGFRASTMVATSTNTSKNGPANPYDCSHITMTYCALCSLLLLGDDLSGVDRQSVLYGIHKLQSNDGSFSSTIDGSENDMRFLYCAACICYMLNDWSGMDCDKAIKYIRSSQTYEGGIGQGPDQEAHGGSTFCAIASLSLMNRLNDAFPSSDLERLKRWIILRQAIGFHSRPNKPDDTCYSFWCGASLKLFGMFDMIDFKKNRSFILETQDDVIGGFAKWPENTPDALHAYLGLVGLSFMKEPKLMSVHPALNISQQAVEHLLKLQKSWKSDL